MFANAPQHALSVSVRVTVGRRQWESDAVAVGSGEK